MRRRSERSALLRGENSAEGGRGGRGGVGGPPLRVSGGDRRGGGRRKAARREAAGQRRRESLAQREARVCEARCRAPHTTQHSEAQKNTTQHNTRLRLLERRGLQQLQAQAVRRGARPAHERPLRGVAREEGRRLAHDVPRAVDQGAPSLAGLVEAVVCGCGGSWRITHTDKELCIRAWLYVYTRMCVEGRRSRHAGKAAEQQKIACCGVMCAAVRYAICALAHRKRLCGRQAGGRGRSLRGRHNGTKGRRHRRPTVSSADGDGGTTSEGGRSDPASLYAFGLPRRVVAPGGVFHQERRFKPIRGISGAGPGRTRQREDPDVDSGRGGPGGRVQGVVQSIREDKHDGHEAWDQSGSRYVGPVVGPSDEVGTELWASGRELKGGGRTNAPW